MEDRQNRLFIALMLTMGIWLAINYIFFPPPPPQKKSEMKTAEKKEAVKKPETPLQVSISAVKASEIKKYHIKTQSLLVEFSSLGGRIEKLYIKNYKDLEGNTVEIARTEDKVSFDGQDYSAIEISRQKGFDFNPAFSREEVLSNPLNATNFNASFDAKNLVLAFDAVAPNKIKIRKEFKFFENENYFKFTLYMQNSGTQEFVVSQNDNLYFKSFSSLGPLRDKQEILERDKPHFFRFYYLDNSFSNNLDGASAEGFFSSILDGDKDNDTRFETIPSNSNEGVDFVGTGSRYFIGVLDPLNHKADGVILNNQNDNTTGTVLYYNNLKIQPGQTTSLAFAAYAGIREPDGMSFRNKDLDPNRSRNSEFVGLSPNLDKSFNQGITTPFRNGIIWILKKLHEFTIPNYGWDIILFALLFKLVFYPLNQKQAESMKKMQALSPEIKVINEKYAKDPQLKQQKIMELYKKHNANPMGGCLPIVIQIPIFIALYTAFSDTIELWRTPFLWINDLSEPDTIGTFNLGVPVDLNVLPLVFVVTQILQTKMTSVSSDPNQKAMMYVMPVIMLYFFWSMPSGVTLYWIIQNIISILQQFITNHKESQMKS